MKYLVDEKEVEKLVNVMDCVSDDVSFAFNKDTLKIESYDVVGNRAEANLILQLERYDNRLKVPATVGFRVIRRAIYYNPKSEGYETIVQEPPRHPTNYNGNLWDNRWEAEDYCKFLNDHTRSPKWEVEALDILSITREGNEELHDNWGKEYDALNDKVKAKFSSEG